MRLGIGLVNHASFHDALNCINSVHHCLRAVRKNVLVVENGTGEADRFRERGIAVIEFGTNRGFAAGVNAIAEHFFVGRKCADAVMFLNPDAWLLEGHWANWLAGLHPGVAAKGPRVLSADRRVQASAYRDVDPRRVALEAMGAHALAEILGIRREMPAIETPVAAVQGSAMLLTRRAWTEVGAFDENFFLYHEEVDWCLRARDRGLEVIYDPSVSVIHEKGTGIPSGREDHYFRGAVRLVAKRYGDRAAAQLRPRLRSVLRWKGRLTRSAESRTALERIVAEL